MCCRRLACVNMITKSHGGSRLTLPLGDGPDDGDIAKNALLFTKKFRFLGFPPFLKNTKNLYNLRIKRS